VGYQAGYDVTGSDNIAIGNKGIDGESATIRIGDADQTRAFIAGIRGTATGIGDALSVVIDSAGQLGTVSSSRRYKQDVSDMGASSSSVMDLRPVTFRHTKAYANGEKPIQYGLIAEEVAEVFPDLVVYNEEGQPETVKYHLLSVILLNELQQQEERISELEAKLDRLSVIEAKLNRLEVLTTGIPGEADAAFVADNR
jgi:hypothetical protein